MSEIGSIANGNSKALTEAIYTALEQLEISAKKDPVTNQADQVSSEIARDAAKLGALLRAGISNKVPVRVDIAQLRYVIDLLGLKLPKNVARELTTLLSTIGSSLEPGLSPSSALSPQVGSRAPTHNTLPSNYSPIFDLQQSVPNPLTLTDQELEELANKPPVPRTQTTSFQSKILRPSTFVSNILGQPVPITGPGSLPSITPREALEFVFNDQTSLVFAAGKREKSLNLVIVQSDNESLANLDSHRFAKAIESKLSDAIRQGLGEGNQLNPRVSSLGANLLSIGYTSNGPTNFEAAPLITNPGFLLLADPTRHRAHLKLAASTIFTGAETTNSSMPQQISGTSSDNSTSNLGLSHSTNLNVVSDPNLGDVDTPNGTSLLVTTNSVTSLNRIQADALQRLPTLPTETPLLTDPNLNVNTDANTTATATSLADKSASQDESPNIASRTDLLDALGKRNIVNKYIKDHEQVAADAADFISAHLAANPQLTAAISPLPSAAMPVERPWFINVLATLKLLPGQNFGDIPSPLIDASANQAGATTGPGALTGYGATAGHGALTGQGAMTEHGTMTGTNSRSNISSNENWPNSNQNSNTRAASGENPNATHPVFRSGQQPLGLFQQLSNLDLSSPQIRAKSTGVLLSAIPVVLLASSLEGSAQTVAFAIGNSIVGGLYLVVRNAGSRGSRGSRGTSRGSSI